MFPTCDGVAEDVVQVPDEEAKRKCSSTGPKEAGDGGLYMSGDAFRDLGVAQEVDGAHTSDSEQSREDDLVVDWIAVDVAIQIVRAGKSAGAPKRSYSTRPGDGVTKETH